MYRTNGILFAAATLVVPGAFAQHAAPSAPKDAVSDNWDVYGTLGASLKGRTGLEVELGVKYQPASWIEFGFSPANLVFFENEDDNFENQDLGNGQSRCRNLSNGQFADDYNCAPDVSWRGAATGELNLGDNLSVGGGYLFGEQESAFGSLRYNFNDTFSLLGRAGEEYASLAIVARF